MVPYLCSYARAVPARTGRWLAASSTGKEKISEKKGEEQFASSIRMVNQKIAAWSAGYKWPVTERLIFPSFLPRARPRSCLDDVFTVLASYLPGTRVWLLCSEGKESQSGGHACYATVFPDRSEHN